MTEPTADTSLDTVERAEPRMPLAAVLDVQVAEVPHTAHAIEYFFGDV